MNTRKPLVLYLLVLLLCFSFWLPAYADPLDLTGTILRASNLRSGPGTSYDIVGAGQPGQSVIIKERSDDGEWYQLSTGEWIAVFLVEVQPATSSTVAATTTPIAESLLEDAYTSALTPIMANYASSMNTFGEQMTAASNNPSLALDKQWRLRTATVLASWKLLGNQLRELQPPARFTDIHKELLTAATHYDKASDLVAAGIDQLSADLIKQGTNEMQLGLAAINRATAMTKNLPTVTPTPIPTKMLTKTPAPTKQSNLTRTPTPTRTPTTAPTATTRSGISVQDRQLIEDYTSDIYPILLEYSSAFKEISTLFSEMPSSPAQILTSQWRIDLIYQLARVKASGNQLRKLTAPPVAKAVHNQLLIGAEHYDNSVNLLADWLDNFDEESIEQVSKEVDSGQAAFDEAQRLLDEINGVG